jgi:alpha-N-arabinofuranosidase
MVNVLQAMIMTDKEKMILTPTYHVFKMYVPFHDATFVPVVFNAGTYTHGEIQLPRVDALAAKDKSGKLWLELTNIDPNSSVEIEVNAIGIAAKSAAGETLTAAKVDSVNTFEAPNTVRPKPMSAQMRDGKLALKLEPLSVTVVSVE